MRDFILKSLILILCISSVSCEQEGVDEEQIDLGELPQEKDSEKDTDLMPEKDKEVLTLTLNEVKSKGTPVNNFEPASKSTQEKFDIWAWSNKYQAQGKIFEGAKIIISTPEVDKEKAKKAEIDIINTNKEANDAAADMAQNSTQTTGSTPFDINDISALVDVEVPELKTAIEDAVDTSDSLINTKDNFKGEYTVKYHKATASETSLTFDKTKTGSLVIDGKQYFIVLDNTDAILYDYDSYELVNPEDANNISFDIKTSTLKNIYEANQQEIKNATEPTDSWEDTEEEDDDDFFSVEDDKFEIDFSEDEEENNIEVELIEVREINEFPSPSDDPQQGDSTPLTKTAEGSYKISGGKKILVIYRITRNNKDITGDNSEYENLEVEITSDHQNETLLGSYKLTKDEDSFQSYNNDVFYYQIGEKTSITVDQDQTKNEKLILKFRDKKGKKETKELVVTFIFD